MNKKIPILQHGELLAVMQEEVKSKIIKIRDLVVITDADVADLYGVETKRINEAVKNNLEKFPPDYMFVLDKEEVQILRSKFSTAKLSPKTRVAPKVFTEKGLYMLATILKSRRSLDVSFAIIETFAKVRYLKKAIIDLHKEADTDEASSKLKQFGEVISDIVMPDLETSETESTLELNFLIGKIKHSVKRTKRSDSIRQL